MTTLTYPANTFDRDACFAFEYDYKGTANIGSPGETNKIKATVKEHQLYDGVQQTVIQRPKLVN